MSQDNKTTTDEAGTSIDQDRNEASSAVAQADAALAQALNDREAVDAAMRSVAAAHEEASRSTAAAVHSDREEVNPASQTEDRA